MVTSAVLVQYGNSSNITSTGGCTIPNMTNCVAYAWWNFCLFYPQCKGVYGLFLHRSMGRMKWTTSHHEQTLPLLPSPRLFEQESPHCLVTGILFKQLWQKYSMPKLFNVPEIFASHSSVTHSKWRKRVFSALVNAVSIWRHCMLTCDKFNPLAPNDIYTHHTTQLTSRHCILNIYSTNTFTEYF